MEASIQAIHFVNRNNGSHSAHVQDASVLKVATEGEQVDP
jgi:hypothetical protein